MKFIFWFILFTISISAFGQDKIIKLEVLPSTYGEGIPVEEFKNFEENIINYLERIPRFELVNIEGRYEDVQYDATGGELTIINPDRGSQTTSPYLLQLVFGDVDWSTQKGAKSSISFNQYSTDSNPNRISYVAKFWLTINLFDVSTGVLKKSIRLQAKSGDAKNYKPAQGPNSLTINAIRSAKKSLWSKTKSALHLLFPPEISIRKILKEKDGRAELIEFNGGGFSGLKKGNSIFIYYEKEYMVRGKPTMRSVRMSQVKILRVARDKCMGEVFFGKEEIVKAIAEGKALKCIVKSKQQSAKGYGF